MLSVSANAPCLEAPSPKKQRTTWPCLRICAAQAAPAACGMPGRDDARGAEEAVGDVGQVHRAADALAEPVPAAVDLGHHRLRVGAARDRVAVAAVGREELVVRPERRDRADDRRLGAVGEVRVAADHARVLEERALDALLELADPQHLRVDPDEPVAVERRRLLRRAHVRAPLVARIGRRSRRRPAGRSRRSGCCAAPRRAPRRPRARRSRCSLAGRDVAADVELALARQVAVVDDLVDRVVHVRELAVAQLDPASRYSSGIRRSSSGAIPSLLMCQVSIAMPPFAAPAPPTTSSAVVDGLDVHVERHELVDDLRVGVLGRVGAELGEALGQLRQLARRAGDVADLDVVGAELGGRVEEQLAASRRRPRGARRRGRGTSPSGTRARGAAARCRRRPASSPRGCASRARARGRRARCRCR